MGGSPNMRNKPMPYVNIQITREGNVTSDHKSALIRGVTEVLRDVLGKDPETTFVVIDEVEMDNWGIGGHPVAEYRLRRKGGSISP